MKMPLSSTGHAPLILQFSTIPFICYVVLSDDVGTIDIEELDISDNELGAILDRDRIFAGEGGSGFPGGVSDTAAGALSRCMKVPVEGDMYDIVLSEAINFLQAVN